MQIYSRYIRNLMRNQKSKKEEHADQSQKVVCDQDKFCNTAYQELEEMSQPHQYDELSCRDRKIIVTKQNEQKSCLY